MSAYPAVSDCNPNGGMTAPYPRQPAPNQPLRWSVASGAIPKTPGNASRQPLLWAALAYSAGVLLGAHSPRPPALWIAAILTLLASSAYLRSRRIRSGFVLALTAFTALGALAIQMRGAHSVLDPQVAAFADGQPVLVTAHVIEEGEVRAQGTRGAIRQRIDVETEQFETKDRRLTARVGLRLSIFGKGELPESGVEYADAEPGVMRVFRYGERLRFTAKLRPPRNFRNPGAFDYESYLADNGIALLGSTRADRIETLPGFAGTRFEARRARIHRSILAKIHALWQPADAALMDAAVLGESAFLTNASRTDFQRSGTYHILVVSGLNVGILTFAMFWLMRRLRLSEAHAASLTVVLSFAYAYLTQVGPPVWRAVLMLTVYLGVRLLFRERSMLNAWGAAVLTILIVDPKALLGASFQLTFLAVLIIAAIGAPCLERTSQPYLRGLRYLDSTSYDARVTPRVAQFRLDLRLLAEKLAPFPAGTHALSLLQVAARAALSLYEILCVATIMQASLVLPMAYYFHRATVLGLPANVVALPMTGILMPAAAAAVALGYVALPIAKVPAWIAAFALHAITGSVRWLGGFRIADRRVPTPDALTIGLCLAVLAVAMFLARRHRALVISGLVLLAAVALWIGARHVRPLIFPNELEVTAIDVGEGDSLLVVSPQGKLLLIDAGGPSGGQESEFDYGENVVSPYLWSRGVERLDVAVVTHAHSDHIGGMSSVLKNFRPRELWTGTLPDIAEVRALRAQADRLGVRVIQRTAGEAFDFGGMQARVLAPPPGWTSAPQARNDDSLVLHLRYGTTAALLEGDAQKVSEARMVSEEPLQADLLKVGHHGSLTSTSPLFLNAVRPKWAVISLGDRNVYGFPRKETLQRLRDAGAQIFRTDQDGAVSFYLDGKSVSVRSVCPR